MDDLLRKADAEGWADWIRSDRDERAVLDGCVFDRSAAQRVFLFFEKFLRHSKGAEWAGQPFVLQQWQKQDLVGPVFGWKRPDGTRRFRRVWCEVGKKNGKSTVCAGVGLYLLVADGEPGADVYSAATKKEQASIVHSEAVQMVRSSPVLRQRLKIHETTKTISDQSTYSKYAALSADAAGSEGLNIHGLIFDEVHVVRFRAFWDALMYGFAARTNPLWFCITTAGIYDKTSLGWQEHEHAKAVMAGTKQDDELYVYIRGATEKDDFLDAKVHEAANPSYGEIIKPAEIMAAAKVAKQKRSQLGNFLRYRLNIWTAEADSAFDMDKWRSCAGKFTEDDLKGRTCWGALDLASKRDIAAWVLMFPPLDDDKWVLLTRYFAPKESAAKRQRDENVPYESWGRDGWINLTEGDCIDYDAIRRQIEADNRAFQIMDVAVDPWQAEYLRQTIEKDTEDLQFFEFAQNMKCMSDPTKEFESMIISRRLLHDDSPVTTWMVGNAMIVDDINGNVRISKKKSKEKVDGVIGAIMALGRSMVSEGAGAFEDGLSIF